MITIISFAQLRAKRRCNKDAQAQARTKLNKTKRQPRFRKLIKICLLTWRAWIICVRLLLLQRIAAADVQRAWRKLIRLAPLPGAKRTRPALLFRLKQLFVGCKAGDEFILLLALLLLHEFKRILYQSHLRQRDPADVLRRRKR